MTNWIDAMQTLPPRKMQTLGYGPELGLFIAMFAPYPAGGGSWEEEAGGEVWFAAPDQVTHWAELTPPDVTETEPQSRTISNITELYVFASNGIVNTLKRGDVTGTHGRTTADVELAIGQRMIVERGDGVLKVEVLP